MDSTINAINEIDNTEVAHTIRCDPEELSKLFNLHKTDLTVISQNIRSIYCNFDDFIATLAYLGFDADVLVLTECRLSSEKPLPLIPNYISLASTYNINQNDGVVIYVKSKFKPKITEVKLDDASCIQIEVLNNLVLGIYRSPSNSNASNFINSLNKYLENIKTYSNIIITGDLNINLIPKLGYDCNNRNYYLNTLAMYGILPGHVSPTRGSSCLDHFMLKFNKMKHQAHIAILNTSVTDHNTILLKLSKTKHNKTCPKIYEIIDYDLAYTNLLQKNLSTLLLSNNPDYIVEQLIENIKKSLEASKTLKHVSKQKRCIKPWMTPGLLRCIRNRNRMQLKLRLDSNNEILKHTFKRYRNFCNRLIKNLKHKYERKLISQSKTQKAIWNTIKTITHFKTTKSFNSELTKIKPTISESINYVNNYFATIGKKLADRLISTTTLCQRKYSAATGNYHSSSFVLLETDNLEVQNVIMSLKSESAPGWDNIPTKFIKLAKNILTPIVCHLVNLCFKQGVFPVLLKRSLVTPVYKGGEKDDVNNYRPISVLSSISKIIEKLMHIRLSSFLTKFKILSNSQFGFRRGLSTEDAVLSVTSLISKLLDQGKKCLAVYLDIKKAFDTVCLTTLVKKLENVGIRGTPLKLFKSYLFGRSQRVKIENCISDDVEILSGVPQGSLLGPTLFLIYINELTNLSIEGGKVFSYADDTALVFSGSSWDAVYRTAELGLAKVINWLKTNLLTLNITKTKYTCFSIRNRTLPNSNYKLRIHNNCSSSDYKTCSCEIVEKVPSMKYLGIFIDERLTWHTQIEFVNNRTRKLIWIFKSLRHVVTPKLLNQIYLSLAQSVLNYCIPIWGGANKTKFINVERAQRCLLKVMYFKPLRFPTTDLYNLCNLLTVRKLYILNTILRVHKHQTVNSMVISRRRDNVIKSERTNTVFARRQFKAQSTFIYNSINKTLNVYRCSKYDCKKIVMEWIKLLTYEETEAILTRMK